MSRDIPACVCVLWVAGVDLDGGVFVVHDGAVEGRVLALHTGDTATEQGTQQEFTTRVKKDTTQGRVPTRIRGRGLPAILSMSAAMR